MPIVDGRTISPDEAIHLGLCPECAVQITPRTAINHARSHWNPERPDLSGEARRRFDLLREFSEMAKPGSRSEDILSRSPTQIPPKTELGNDRLAEFLGFVFLEILAAPPAYDGWQALKAGDMKRAFLFYVISAVPCIAGFIVLSGAWARTRSKLSRWATDRIYPIATDFSYWLGLIVIVFVYMATPILLFQLKSAIPVEEPTPLVNINTRPHERAVDWPDFFPSWSIDLEGRLMHVKQPCILKVTAVPEHLRLRSVLIQIATENGICATVDDSTDANPPVPDIDAPPTPTPPAGLSIRWNKETQPQGESIAGWFQGVGFIVNRGHVLPLGSQPTEIWIEIGPGFLWQQQK
jgi:hypothetical protein